MWVQFIVGIDINSHGRGLIRIYSNVESCRHITLVLCHGGRDGDAAHFIGHEIEPATVWFNIAPVDRTSDCRIEEACLGVRDCRGQGKSGNVRRRRQEARAGDRLVFCEHEAAHEPPVHARYSLKGQLIIRAGERHCRCRCTECIDHDIGIVVGKGLIPLIFSVPITDCCNSILDFKPGSFVAVIADSDLINTCCIVIDSCNGSKRDYIVD